MLEEADRLAALRRHGILDTPAEAAFDRAVELARTLCGAPVALVSLVDAERQWFKAKAGLETSETPLDTAICDLVVRQGAFLQIPDLTADARTAHMSLVAGEAHFRFYAGVPLVDDAGAVLGSLCVVDREPRPQGLSATQEQALALLAEQVATLIRMRTAVAERDRALASDERLLRMQEAEHRRDESEQRYRFLFGAIDEGFCIIRFLDGPKGPMRDYVHVEANAAFERHLGIPHIAGQTLREIVAEDEAEGWLKVYGEVLRTGEPVRFERRFGPTGRDLEVSAYRVEPASRREVAVLFTDVTERRSAQRALEESEAHWRSLFEKLQEGFILGEVVRDASGEIVDWRYLDVNAAWGELLSIDERTVVGRTISEVLPGVEPEWIDLARVVDSGGSISFTRQVGRLERWYDGRASAVGPDTFSVLFVEVTDRVRAARALAESSARKSALAELGDCLRAAMDVKAMATVTSSIVGRTLGASRAGYGSVDARRERVDITSDWCAPGIASIAGVHAFRDFGSYIDDLRQGRLVVIPDVRLDPRTAANSRAFEALGIRALINAPVLEQGEIVAVCLAQWATPHAISSEEQAFVRAAADRTQVGVARLRADERQAVLNGEISHRLKNTLAMVQAIAAQTLKDSTEPGALNAFAARLVALSRAQDVLLASEWRSAELSTVVAEVLDAAGAKGRYTAEGPPVQLGPRAALTTSLLLHELTTNALKYGALSRPEGRVALAWAWSSDGDEAELTVDWLEVGGPPATPPVRKGFGSRLLRLGLAGAGSSELSYGAAGFSASFRAPRKQVEHA